MKWFKCMSDNLDDPFIFDIIDSHGGDAYLAYFGIISIMAKEFDIDSPGICTLSVRFLAKKLQLSRQKVIKFTKLFNEKGKIFCTLKDDEITLNCPKLKTLCDEWTAKQLRSSSIVTPAQEVEVEVEVEEDNKYSEFDFETAERYKQLLIAKWPTYPSIKKADVKKWAEEVRKLREIDGFDQTFIIRVIDFAIDDDFWSPNMRSLSGLRKKGNNGNIKFENIMSAMDNKQKKKPKHSFFTEDEKRGGK